VERSGTRVVTVDIVGGRMVVTGAGVPDVDPDDGGGGGGFVGETGTAVVVVSTTTVVRVDKVGGKRVVEVVGCWEVTGGCWEEDPVEVGSAVVRVERVGGKRVVEVGVVPAVVVVLSGTSMYSMQSFMKSWVAEQLHLKTLSP